MKKGIAAGLVILLAFSLVLPMYAAENTVSALLASEVKNAEKSASGYYLTSPGAYIAFDGMDLSGIKSVTLTTTNVMSEGNDGDYIAVRADSPTGEVLGYVDVDTYSKEPREFSGALKSLGGVHKVYFVSLLSRSRTMEIRTVRFSQKTYEAPVYTPVPEDAIREYHASTWALTDDLGRKAANYEEVGDLKEGRSVGMFYWTWHSSFETCQPLNNSEFAKLYPEAKHDYYSKLWPNTATVYYWNEPLFGYYSGIDYWVYRKHAAMLSAAGVDAILFDCTNGTNTWRRQYQVLFSALHDARAAGTNAPKVAFITPFSPTNESTKNNVTRIYVGAYKDKKYSDLWFYWEGKPLILAYTDTLVGTPGDAADEALMQEIKSFFTFRGPQSSYVTGQVLPDQWGWLETYPQNGYTPNADGSFEEVTVGVAVNHSYVEHSMTAMNSEYAMGRSYTEKLGQDVTEGAYKYGYFFTEQLRHALTVDAELMFIDGWNEWHAGRYQTWNGVKNAFPDTYDNEGSRDMEPTKGDMKDNYYVLLVDACRRFKGAEKTPVASAEKTVSLSDPATWDDVLPVYENERGTYDRDYPGFMTQYENHTARNNVVTAKVARDKENLYFYAACDKDVTAPSGDAWMKLYLDTDRNHATGWEGYDYVVNSPKAGDVTNLTTGDVKKAEFVRSGNVLTERIARADVGLDGTLNFEFKWVDNASGDIMNFYTDGNAAPLGRFNYVYTECEEISLPAEERSRLSGVTVVKNGSARAFCSGAKVYTYEPDTRYGTRVENGKTYIPAALLENGVTDRVKFDSRGMLKLMGDDFYYTTAGTNEFRKNGVLNSLTTPVIAIDGLPYIAAEAVAEIYGMELYETGDVTAFGKAIDRAAVDALADRF